MYVKSEDRKAEIMALRKILTFGDETLGKKSRPIEKFDGKLHALLDDMAETMYKANGVGLAAVQIGILRRVVVIDTGDELIELINPEIIEESGEQTDKEGCLSLPGKFGDVTRPMNVKVRAQDRFGDFFEIEGEELLARAFCHEIEHLDGHLFIEKASNVEEISED